MFKILIHYRCISLACSILTYDISSCPILCLLTFPWFGSFSAPINPFHQLLLRYSYIMMHLLWLLLHLGFLPLWIHLVLIYNLLRSWGSSLSFAWHLLFSNIYLDETSNMSLESAIISYFSCFVLSFLLANFFGAILVWTLFAGWWSIYVLLALVLLGMDFSNILMKLS